MISKVGDENVTDIEYIKDGDIITFKHNDSNKRLHSHDHRPPMTDVEYHNEVRLVVTLSFSQSSDQIK